MWSPNNHRVRPRTLLAALLVIGVTAVTGGVGCSGPNELNIVLGELGQADMEFYRVDEGSDVEVLLNVQGIPFLCIIFALEGSEGARVDITTTLDVEGFEPVVRESTLLELLEDEEFDRITWPVVLRLDGQNAIDYHDRVCNFRSEVVDDAGGIGSVEINVNFRDDEEFVDGGDVCFINI